MNKYYHLVSTILLVSLVILSGCAGMQPFNQTARAGDTIAIAAGWKHEFSRDKLTVTITPSSGSDIVYLPNDNAVRASVNFYADPASYMAVGYETGLDGSSYNFGKTYAGTIMSNFTGYDPDWWQTVVFVNLPASLPVGTANVSLVSNGSLGESWSVPVEIVAGVGSPHPFDAELLGGLTDPERHALERAPNYEVQFDGPTVPFAIQVELSHDAGVGKPYIITPRGDITSLNWSDDGQNTKVLLNFTKITPLHKVMTRFKFYVSGSVTGLQIQNVKAYDANGDPVTGVSANIIERI